MKRFICVAVVLCFMMSGCAYYGKTAITTKGKNIKAIAGGVPISGDADVVIARECWWSIFRNAELRKDSTFEVVQ